MNTNNDYEFHIEPFGQQPGLWNLYTQLTFCYALKNESLHSRITTALVKGLERLAAGFPWIAGQMVKERQDSIGSDYFVIKPLGIIPEHKVRDLRSVLSAFEVYQQSDFPIRLLDENLVAPRNTKSIVDESEPKPIFLVQVTFIDNGFLLTFAGQHGTLDVVGLGEMIRLYSKACHNIPFTAEEIRLGNCDRRLIIPLLDEERREATEPVDARHMVRQRSQEAGKDASSTVSSRPVSVESLENIWASFVFSADSLRALKMSATDGRVLASGFVSTDDTLSAFIWQRVSVARLPRLEPTDTTSFARTVDVRRYLDISPTYPGNLATKVFHTRTFRQLVGESLGSIASEMRLAVNPKTSNIGHDVQVAATDLTSPRQVAKPAKSSRDLSKDIALSSWTKLDWCYDLDFGLDLGKPEAVRRPSFSSPNDSGMEGVIYLLPKGPNDEIVVSLCLRKRDLERLCLDGEWTKHARFTG